MLGPIHQLLYMSKASPSLTQSDVQAILATARTFNSEHAVTGLLIFRDGRFLQLLEGRTEAVKETYERITHDKRHAQIIMIQETFVERRLFASWSMAYGEELVAPDVAVKLFSNLDRAMRNETLDQQVIMSILEHFAKHAQS